MSINTISGKVLDRFPFSEPHAWPRDRLVSLLNRWNHFPSSDEAEKISRIALEFNFPKDDDAESFLRYLKSIDAARGNEGLARPRSRGKNSRPKKLRTCIACLKKFKSDGRWNRMCDKCKASETVRIAMPTGGRLAIRKIAQGAAGKAVSIDALALYVCAD